MNARWSQFFFTLCRANAAMSKDPSTQVGAVIVRPDKTVASMGFNGFPRWIDDAPDLYANRDAKLSRILHAEANALLTARESLAHCSLFVWPFPPCDRCAAQIIQAGIARVYCPPLPTDAAERWAASVAGAERMFREAGVVLAYDKGAT